MRIEAVRKLAGREEVDYQFLLAVLAGYSRPRDKISAWMKSGDLIRVKKGLYVFGQEAALQPYSLEVLANLIYGPSAISLSYALSFYGMIPERVTTITSITNKRNKAFSTPVGEFTYQFLHQTKYPIEIELVNSSNQHPFLIASPEKALCDYLYLTDKKIKLKTLDDMDNYLRQDLRIDESALSKLHTNKLASLNQVYEDDRLALMTTYIKKWKASS